MKTNVIRTSSGNYVALINNVETFISKDGSKSNPVQNPCFEHLSKHNCRPIELEYTSISEIPALFEKTLKESEEAWQAYLKSDEYLKEKEQRAKDREKFEAERLANIIADYNNLIAGNTVIPTTVENIRIVLNYLNTQNWGVWALPKMSISYSANQYNCDGKIASTMILDKPISDEETGIENERHFKVGGSQGHLNKYQRL